MWCASMRKLPQLTCHPLSIAGARVCPVNAVRDLGVFIDNDSEGLPMFGEPCHAALLHFASSVTFVDTSPTTASALWWCRLCCALKTRLRQLRPGRTSCLCTAAPPVCFQRCGSSGILTTSLRPCHGRPCNSALAASTTTC